MADTQTAPNSLPLPPVGAAGPRAFYTMTTRLLARQFLCALPLFFLLALAAVAVLMNVAGRRAFEELADMATSLRIWMEER